MNPEEQRQIADSFGVTPELVPWLPELLADLWALGSWPEGIAQLLRDRAAVPSEARVLDLGCGKGAVAIHLAQELGLKVHGIDLFVAFIEEAQGRAESAGVEHLCRFETGDLRNAVRTFRDFEVAVLAGVGAGVLGGYARCVAEIRRTVRRGGFLVIDDGFLQESAEPTQIGYEYYGAHDETVSQLTASGDRLVGELLVPGDELVEYNRRSTALIRRRAGKLARRRPELAGVLRDYVRSEEEECRFLEGEATAAVWLLERC